MVIKRIVSSGILFSIAKNMIVRGFGLPAALVLSIFLARVLGPAEFGIYSFILSTALFIDKPLSASIATLMIRQVAHKSAGELRLAVITFTSLVARYAALSILFWWFLLSLIGVAMPNAENLLAYENNYYILVLLPLLFVFGFGSALLRAMHFTTLAILPEQLLRPVCMLLILSVVYIASDSLELIDAQNILNYYIFVLCGLTFMALTVVWKLMPKPEKISKDIEISEDIRSFLILYFMSLVQAANAYMPILFLGFFHTAADVGIYRAAANIATNVGLGLLAVNLTIAPKIVRAYRSNDLEALQRMLVVGSRVVISIALPLAVVFSMFSDVLVSTLFGDEYIESASILGLLSGAFFVNAICGPVGMTMNMMKLEKETIRAVFVAALVNLGLCLLLIPSMGVAGAAYSMVACFFIWNGILMLRLYQLKGLLVLPWVFRNVSTKPKI